MPRRICEITGCLNRAYEDSPYCETRHLCKYGKDGCNNCKAQGLDHCNDHTCRINDCTQVCKLGYRYCIKHKCEFDDCDNAHVDDWEACSEHQCEYPEDAEKYNLCTKCCIPDSDACRDHRCQYSSDCMVVVQDGCLACVNHVCGFRLNSDRECPEPIQVDKSWCLWHSGDQKCCYLCKQDDYTADIAGVDVCRECSQDKGTCGICGNLEVLAISCKNESVCLECDIAREAAWEERERHELQMERWENEEREKREEEEREREEESYYYISD